MHDPGGPDDPGRVVPRCAAGLCIIFVDTENRLCDLGTVGK